MRRLSIFLILITLASCGQDGTESSTSLANPVTSQMQGILAIPKPGLIGGGIGTIQYNQQSFNVDSSSSSSEAYQFVLRIYNNPSTAIPFSQDSHRYYYRVNFRGAFIQGQCPTNPMSQCSNVSLQSISPY